MVKVHFTEATHCLKGLKPSGKYVETNDFLLVRIR